MISVRPARVSDLPAIVELWEALMAAHFELEPELYRTEPHGPDTYRAWVRRHMGDRKGVVFVAEDANVVLGYVLGAVGQRSPVFSVRRVGMIFDLVVRQDQRRRGVGRTLVEASRERFEDFGIRHLQLNFDPRNEAAAGFWEKMGFEILLCEAYIDLAGG
jgi:ribosomal protein S18 acetylase RimI-like enzyme